MVQSLRRSAANWTRPIRILFVTRADAEQSTAFFAHHWPEAEVMNDPHGEVFRSYRIPRAGWELLLDPRTWWLALRAWLGGHRLGWPTRDPWQMPGYVLIEDDQVLWRFQPRYAGERPAWNPPPWEEQVAKSCSRSES